MNKKYIVIGAIVLLVVGFIAGSVVGGNDSQSLGAANRIPNGYWDTADGYYVDGSAVITGAGKLTSAKDITLSGANSCIQVVNSTGSTTAVTFVGSGATTTTVTATLGTCSN